MPKIRMGHVLALFAAVVGLLLFAGALYWGKYVVPLENVSPNFAKSELSPGTLVYMESPEDFPNEPSGLHPTKLIANERTMATPDLSNTHKVSARKDGIYYFDEREHVVKTSGGKTLNQTLVTNADLSGYFLVSLDGERIAWSDTNFKNGESEVALKISTIDTNGNKSSDSPVTTLHTQTFSGQQTLVPLAWSPDAKTLWYGLLNLDEQVAGVQKYSKLFQVATDTTDIEPTPLAEREVVSPASDLLPIGIDAERGRAFYLRLATETGSQMLVLSDLLTEEVTEYLLSDTLPIISSYAQNEEFIALNLRSGDQTQNQILLINTTTDLSQSLATLTDQQEVVGFVDGSLYMSRTGINRGTWKLDLDGASSRTVGATPGAVESRVNSMRAITIVPESL